MIDDIDVDKLEELFGKEIKTKIDDMANKAKEKVEQDLFGDKDKLIKAD